MNPASDDSPLTLPTPSPFILGMFVHLGIHHRHSSHQISEHQTALLSDRHAHDGRPCRPAETADLVRARRGPLSSQGHRHVHPQQAVAGQTAGREAVGRRGAGGGVWVGGGGDEAEGGEQEGFVVSL